MSFAHSSNSSAVFVSPGRTGPGHDERLVHSHPNGNQLHTMSRGHSPASYDKKAKDHELAIRDEKQRRQLVEAPRREQSIERGGGDS